MKVDSVMPAVRLDEAPAAAARKESSGFDGLWNDETAHDPFLPLVLAAEATTRVELGTSIAVAFARSPMTLAMTANDLQHASGGRFILGLGSQIKAHVERRFSMPWSRPALRMREYVLALQAIWGSWNEGETLDFRGDFYAHTLMTPFFDPGPNPFGPPKVFIAAVGPRMTAVAGEVADGLLLHSFTTERYLREATLPALTSGLQASGRTRDTFEIAYSAFVVTGVDEDEVAKAARAMRDQIAFYGSTAAYRPVLALHGWDDLHVELNALSKSDRSDRWKAMGGLIDDEILSTFAVVAEPSRVAAMLRDRYGGAVDRISFYTPYWSDRHDWTPILEELHCA